MGVLLQSRRAQAPQSPCGVGAAGPVITSPGTATLGPGELCWGLPPQSHTREGHQLDPSSVSRVVTAWSRVPSENRIAENLFIK